MKRFTLALSQAGIEYRVIGGMAVMWHVRDRDLMAARLTNDVDAAVQRADLPAIISTVEPFGFQTNTGTSLAWIWWWIQPNRLREAPYIWSSWEKRFARSIWSRCLVRLQTRPLRAR
jgi:hypothetical protein